MRERGKLRAYVIDIELGHGILADFLLPQRGVPEKKIMDITLYEFSPSRSVRCRWTLQELGLAFESVQAREIMGTDDYKKIHPLGKLPALQIDGRTMFESAAICTYLADLVPAKGLIAKPGDWERAMHEQWVCYALTEMEAHLWSSARNTFVYPEEQRIDAIFDQNAREFQRAAGPLDAALAQDDFLVGNRFSVTDIIVAFTVNWAGNAGQLDGFRNLERYLDRLYDRPHCPLAKK